MIHLLSAALATAKSWAAGPESCYNLTSGFSFGERRLSDAFRPMPEDFLLISPERITHINKPNALVVSLHFNPGHFSHLAANYKLFEDSGFTPYLYITKSFNKMDEKNEFTKINSPKELKELKTIDAVVFWFPSLRNITEIIRIKLSFKNSKIIYVYHEPLDSIKSYYDSGFSFGKIIKILIVHLVNIPVILLSDRIVLPSTEAFLLYRRKFTGLNRNYSRIPLLFDDEAAPLSHETPKQYISYIGTVAADHAFDRFIDFVRSAIDNGWFPDLKFLIATSSRIPARERATLRPYLQSGKVSVFEGRPMTTDEINRHYRESLVVWNAYNRSMQSGVLPKSFMFGAAVIGSHKNEFIDDHKTGVLIKDNKDVMGIKDAVAEIADQKKSFFRNCREKFLEVFYYKSRATDYLDLLDDRRTADHAALGAS
jgi:hypothetical protein